MGATAPPWVPLCTSWLPLPTAVWLRLVASLALPYPSPLLLPRSHVHPTTCTSLSPTTLPSATVQLPHYKGAIPAQTATVRALLPQEYSYAPLCSSAALCLRCAVCHATSVPHRQPAARLSARGRPAPPPVPPPPPLNLPPYSRQNSPPLRQPPRRRCPALPQAPRLECH